MSGPLERRLERPEAGAGIGASYPAIFVRFGRPGADDPPVATATASGRVWYRVLGELEAEFLERVGTEARHIRPGGVVVAFLD